jgi:hypothetical protein
LENRTEQTAISGVIGRTSTKEALFLTKESTLTSMWILLLAASQAISHRLMAEMASGPDLRDANIAFFSFD